MISAVRDHGDYYLVSDDFHSYIETHAAIDEAYKNQDEWLTKCITSVARMGFFSSDRCINEYAEESKYHFLPLLICILRCSLSRIFFQAAAHTDSFIQSGTLSRYR